MKSYAMPERLTAECFEALDLSVKEHFCSKCYDRKCEACNVNKFLARMKEKVA